MDAAFAKWAVGGLFFKQGQPAADVYVRLGQGEYRCQGVWGEAGCGREVGWGSDFGGAVCCFSAI